MTITLTLSGNNLSDIKEAVATLNSQLNGGVFEAVQEEKPKRKAREAKEESVVPLNASIPPSKYTLKDVMDFGRELTKNNNPETIDRVEELNMSFGLARMTQLAPQHVDKYMEKLKEIAAAKAEPVAKASSAGLFD